MNMNKKMVGLIVILIMVIIGGFWFLNNSDKSSVDIGTANPSARITAPPMLRPEPPKLAGKVLIGPKTKTK
jgi:hypothetical protein